MKEFPVLDDYDVFYIRKRKNNKKRQIESPKTYIREKQKEHIEKILLSDLPFSEFAHGFIKGKSIVTNAMPHIGKKYILKMDIKDFFPSSNWYYFENMYLELLNHKRDMKILSNWFKTEDCNDQTNYKNNLNTYKIHFLFDGKNIRLPQGGLASPFIANFMLKKFDSGIAMELYFLDRNNTHKISYTRYADDITISSNNLEILNTFIPKVKKYLKKDGYKVNDKKTVIIPYWKKQKVCGIVVNSKLHLDRKIRKKIRAIKYQLENGQIEINNHIKGLLAYYDMVMKNKEAKVISNIYDFFSKM